MRILSNVYEQIINQQNPYPPESGGVLGRKAGMIVEYYHDCGMQSDYMCSYIPNTKLLNRIIAEWQLEGIEFAGIYHTHFGGATTLSHEDKKYMKKILENMPRQVAKLYFPIVAMPQMEMVCYEAEVVDGELIVKLEKLEKDPANIKQGDSEL